jgi:hypothetical protein
LLLFLRPTTGLSKSLPAVELVADVMVVVVVVEMIADVLVEFVALCDRTCDVTTEDLPK